MSRRLVYVMGPSGVGKDSLLDWLKAHAPGAPAVHFARRTVTRAADAGGEAHEALDSESFEQQARAGAFALHWRGNGLRYGVRHDQLAPLECAQWVLVNGSRGYLPQALMAYPDLTAVQITAQPETLRRRLTARGRESPAEVQARLQRALDFAVPAGALCIANDGALQDAGQALLRLLARLD